MINKIRSISISAVVYDEEQGKEETKEFIISPVDSDEVTAYDMLYQFGKEMRAYFRSEDIGNAFERLAK